MEVNEIIAELRRMQVKIGSLTCLSCDHCGVRGCEIIREAADKIEVQAGLLKYGSNKIHDLERELEDERAMHEWLDPDVELPPDTDAVLGLVNGEYGGIGHVDAMQLVCYSDDDGWWLFDDPKTDVTVRRWMPLPEPPEVK